MTKRQQQFAIEYVKDANATQAAIRAGFSPNGASVQASRMLRNASVQKAINELREPILVDAGITLESHLKELAALREAAKTDGQYAAAVTAETNRGKVAGYYTERVEHSGGVEVLAFRRKSA